MAECGMLIGNHAVELCCGGHPPPATSGAPKKALFLQQEKPKPFASENISWTQNGLFDFRFLQSKECIFRFFTESLPKTTTKTYWYFLF
jgi:hypothetical protein